MQPAGCCARTARYWTHASRFKQHRCVSLEVGYMHEGAPQVRARGHTMLAWLAWWAASMQKQTSSQGSFLAKAIHGLYAQAHLQVHACCGRQACGPRVHSLRQDTSSTARSGKCLAATLRRQHAHVNECTDCMKGPKHKRSEAFSYPFGSSSMMDDAADCTLR